MLKHTENDTDLVALALTQIESGQETLDSFLEKYAERAQQLRPELEAALWLNANRPNLEPRPGFLTASRKNLVNTLRIMPLAQTKTGLLQRLFPRPAKRNTLLEVLSLLTLIVCLAFVTNNIILISELSLPGEPLYQVKLSLERSRLAFTFDAEDDTRLHIDMTQRRTSEIIELILDKDYPAIPASAERLERQLEETMAALEDIEKTDPAASQALSLAYQENLATESMILKILLDTYPPDARQYIELALQVTDHGLTALQD
jgi:hypothetical protein